MKVWMFLLALFGAVLSANVAVADGRAKGYRGTVAVLDLGPSLPAGFRTAYRPAALAEALRSAAFDVELLSADQFADRDRFNARAFDAVILPYGPLFPAKARETFQEYLRAGGSFLSTDGYAFDRPIAWNGSAWLDTKWPAGPPMNTRTGKPGDAMDFAPEQIGIFDPAFTLEKVSSVRGVGPWSGFAPKEPLRDASGFAACALIGDNNPVFPPVYRRWIPILETFDAQGKPRGSALSLVNNYGGVYRKSSWAFSGLTSGQDLFLGTPAKRSLLAAVTQAVIRKTYLRSLRTDFQSYRRGETAVVSVDVANDGRASAQLALVVKWNGRVLASDALDLRPGVSTGISLKVAVDGPDYCPITAELFRDGQPIDRMESAACIWDPVAVARGPKVGWQGNYLTLNGRPGFWIGTNQTGMMFYSEHEDPAVWDRDLREMAASGIRILRILHFSPFAAGGYQGRAGHTSLDLKNRPDRLRRQLDAIVQLAQKRGIVIFLALHDWLDIALTDEELRAQADWDRFWAARYKDVPGIMFDVQNEPSVDMPDRPHVRALWNRWLVDRYGSDAALRAAWWKHPPAETLPNILLPPRTEEWDDIRQVDRKRFEVFLLDRWVRANVQGVKAGNPRALVTVGYLPDMAQADKILGARRLDFSNMHFYGSLRDLPLELKLTDHRWKGQGFSLGEFGAQEAHDARTRGETGMPVEESVRRFQATIHYAAGMGAAFIANWDWKEFDESIFPWGLVQRGEHVPKPWLTTIADEARFLSFVRPKYTPPSVYLLVPDSHRLGPHFGEIHSALQRSAELLFQQGVPFGVLNEDDLDRIPPSAKAIAWPIPYCPSDAVFAHVLAWVQGGGTLYLSGDVSFDPNRQPTRSARRHQFGLPEAAAVSPFAVPMAAWSTPVVETRVEKGRVFFASYPLEMRPRPEDSAVYARWLTAAGAERSKAAVSGGEVRTLNIRTDNGGTLFSLVRVDEGRQRLAASLPGHRIVIDLEPGGCAFVLLNAKGEVAGAESAGRIIIDGKTVATGDGHFGLIAKDGAGLLRSRARLVLPHAARGSVIPRP